MNEPSQTQSPELAAAIERIMREAGINRASAEDVARFELAGGDVVTEPERKSD